MKQVALIGAGFVADLYVRSFETIDGVEISLVHDRDADRLAAFCGHWGLPSASSLQEFFDQLHKDTLILNLTNPTSHFEINKACLAAGFHVYSEKPLALTMDEARSLHALAQDQGLTLAGAPCSMLGEAAQTLAKAVRDDVAGPVRLVYAELDDGFIPQAPHRKWQSESGAPWPYEDEIRTGCTLEHAGYYLGWLIGMFGSVRTVVAASAGVIPDKIDGPGAAPDFSVGTLFFENGVVARLTCSIVATHNHEIRVIGDKGVLAVDQAWKNAAAVKFHKRVVLRRRLVESPLGRRIKLPQPTHPKVGRRGAASMNFALGPVEVLDAIGAGRSSRLSADFALHLNEVTLALQNAGETTGAQAMTTTCPPMEPMSWAK